MQVRKFLALGWADKLLLVRAFSLLCVITFALRTVQFQRLQRWLKRRAEHPARNPGAHRPTPERIAWATSIASRYVPKGVCLPQALVAQYLLKSYAYQATLHIGVAKPHALGLQAHAWVESHGKIVIGDHGELNSLTQLSPLQSELPDAG